MIGEAEQDIARSATVELGREIRGGRGVDQRSEAPSGFGRGAEPGRVDQPFSERRGHS